MCIYVCLMCMCVLGGEREEREMERERVYVCVCLRERKRERVCVCVDVCKISESITKVRAERFEGSKFVCRPTNNTKPLSILSLPDPDL